ncbi:MAG: hypothetical protein QF681_09480 [Vicinamibacterales bacterium]|jgi:hypothetical protein|nr:hypothetical protein [Vicinamibacterales bacterium]
MAHTFPSVEWFQALADIANGDDDLKKFGTLDATVVFKVAEQHYSVTFDILQARDVHESSADDALEADFVIELSPEKWQGMIDDIQTNGRAGRDWTLNTLDMIDDEPIHKNLGQDGFAADKFHRYGPTLQRFMDNSSQLETEFAGAAVTT